MRVSVFVHVLCVCVCMCKNLHEHTLHMLKTNETVAFRKVSIIKSGQNADLQELVKGASC
jgi:hypothetical protein